jgi:hypothetical protein
MAVLGTFVQKMRCGGGDETWESEPGRRSTMPHSGPCNVALTLEPTKTGLRNWFAKQNVPIGIFVQTYIYTQR